ncbi:lipoyltransferase and lipoate-protein ligase [Planoprotostelium fungivorum]|uniref:lipoate--protein ligase n=1 Tax=Planoprotostelium fungivorum TaxID=1890364 RepID=A0A2P6NHV7_9EUKA|nr:lipoyltransferase and lipoate-protein ligase [Planoprotostelium fungivorum]
MRQISPLSRRSFTTTSAPQPVRVLLSKSTDPYLNLAIEDWLFHHGQYDKQTLYLWRNEPTVVIGRNQNPWKECDVKALERDSIHLVRRSSGGGAVYHDLGNSCFSFFSDKSSYDKNKNSLIICDALRHFNITASPNTRNDILVNDRKISGSAYRLSGKRCLHHGTLLISTHLHNLQKYLYVGNPYIKSAGVASVRSPVQNLSHYAPMLTHDLLMNAITKEFFHHYGHRCGVELLDEEEMKKIPQLSEAYENLRKWGWRFGETPSFEHKLQYTFLWGTVSIHLHSEEGRFKKVEASSEPPEVLEGLSSLLEGKAYDRHGLSEAMEMMEDRGSTVTQRRREVEEWLVREM